ncbi:MAG TPA: phospholipid carrier-dependent glycosyltransferase [Ruminiclostridium sp.]|jgi:dolichyl-phosphate-mannose--protein O-mannosyl transferase|uniref:Polyprenol-phosphate-mannose--protein mannosyltransferase n=1 Tax=Acetivibrio saccincola TaxID=1677857 RepID=A0A2K9EDS8_9FIRM|nr:glycosyltransferase family 39 protein [Acetivibrio saccincola]HAA42938.1 phospholipid carrier-dependent glycosyltransferase [Ruminiclostridium sp.]AUG58294.1 putative dolichyl-phosphate-mannose--protein mannosyltransferase [Acetivibrio saccincola]NLW27926.1 phospholipid carrier-dependent glycosyltransferase [Acetivibrio saccincola]PQQ68176.1 phospholipid carrier-dependent glycosyltransferase [Acetivibrio saccincola]HQD29845.1 glycosyltransferase family 39 protein [Acetivibrio saccincola]
MSKKVLGIFFIILIFSICNVCGFAQEESLVQNPGFEMSDEYARLWETYHWSEESEASEFGIDETVSHTGSKSAYIVSNSMSDARYVQHVPVKGDTFYKFSCWVKTENVPEDTLGANISVLYTLTTSRGVTGTTENWEYVEFYGKTSPNQETVALSLALGGHGKLSSGKAWFDTVEVVEVSEIPVGETAQSLEPDNSSQSGDAESKSSGKILSMILIPFAILIYVLFILYKSKKSSGNDKNKNTPSDNTKNTKKNTNNTLPPEDQQIFKVSFDKKDIIIMIAMTAIYLVIALYNLGSFKVPTTSWESVLPGESFTVDLGKEATLSRVYFFTGLGGGVISVEYLDENQNFSNLMTFQKDKVLDIFKWKYQAVSPVTTSKLRFTFESTNMTINEIAIVEQGSTVPLTGIKVVDKNVGSNNKGNIENLFDEHDKFAYRPSFMNSMYLDEIYHARTAFEHIHGIQPYETTHPPLGKVFMALGVLIFGMVPFGWRIMGTLFGVAMVPAMYAFGKKVFHDRFFAFSAAFLMMFDSMHFAQTRIATIDSYVTLFVILMYYYMYDYFVNKSYVLGFKQSLKPLFLSGLFFGFGAASKWIAFYGAAGLAVLFFLNKYLEYTDYRKIAMRSKKKPAWFHDYESLYLFGTMGLCVIFFVIIPGIIYVLSYLSWPERPGTSLFKTVVDNFKYMLSYHSKLTDTHPYQSAWWEWPFMSRPMAFYFGSDLPAGVTSKIYTLGNPAVWWTGIVAFLAIAAMALTKVKKQFSLLFVLAASSFAYISIPKDFIPSEVWILSFILLTLTILISSNFDKKIIAFSVGSAAIFSVIAFSFHNVIKTNSYYVNFDNSYYKNPSVQSLMWIFLLTSIIILLVGIFRFDRKFFPIVLAMIFQYVPWVGVPRCTFIYHYFTIIPFLILCILYVIKKVIDKWQDFKYFAYIYLALVLVVFILFYPVVSGMHVNTSYLKLIGWFWNF